MITADLEVLQRRKVDLVRLSSVEYGKRGGSPVAVKIDLVWEPSVEYGYLGGGG